jgi:phosphoribosylaminoimidazole carboxylase (NCAIR synthetase)
MKSSILDSKLKITILGGGRLGWMLILEGRKVVQIWKH